MKIYAGSDHAGFKLRSQLVERLRGQGHEVVDLGTAAGTTSDYPDHAGRVARAVRGEPGSRGLLVCGSGIGVSMAANKVHGVRAVAPWDVESARLSRAHNDANVLCLGERLIPEPEATAIVDVWLATPFEGGRHAPRIAKMAGLEASESAAAAIEGEIARLERRDLVPRVWAKDPRAFTADPAHEAPIRNRLGWLTSPDEMAPRVAELARFAQEIRDAGFRHAVLLGMGGSSLCPEVLARTFGAAPGFPGLIVLDSTDPAAVAEVEQAVDLDRTLFVVASKSGGTIEIRAFERYFWARVLERRGGDPQRTGAQFVAITDPGTKLDRQATELGYRAIFRNPADIGGRFSAISYFGLVPAAALGVDVGGLVDGARRMAESCRAPAIAQNPGARLGALLGAMAKQGRDKLTLLASPEIAALGAWIEQLVAESTGKLGKGILPVDGEPIGAPQVYGDDRVFVTIALRGGAPAAPEAALEALRAAGHPVVELVLDDRLALGAELFRWEMATAVAGASLEVDPFDEPNVSEAKEATGKLLDAFVAARRLPAPGRAAARPDDVEALAAHLATLRPGDYLCFSAFFRRSDERERLIGEARAACRDRLRVATTVGFGPRFLHSTGQLHKGGPATGVFVQLVADAPTDLAVPGEPWSFAVLRDAQALGDFQVLERHGRRALRVHLGADVEGGLARLRDAIGRALPVR